MLITNFNSKTLYCTQNCQQISKTKDHAVIGISPFNSYYSETKIALLIKWAFEAFNNFHIFIPDTLPIYNFLALGYEKDKAEKKTYKQTRYLKNKIIRAGVSIGFSEENIHSRIIDINKLESNTSFTHNKILCYELFEKDHIFREECLIATQWILNGYETSEKDIDKEIAVRYLLDEMPLFINTPSILDVPSSVFCYHQTPNFIKTLYNNSNRAPFLSLQQGFVEVSFDKKIMLQGENIQHEISQQ